MFDRIKNSLLYKCLQVLMIGYFSISSINISNSFAETINASTELHSLKGMTCHLLKKIFKCDGTIEEIEDYNTKSCKTAKLAKGIPLLDYLIPSDTSWSGLHFQIESAAKNYMASKIFSFGFHGRIHVPPPQMIA